MRVAYYSPLPPERSGIADYSAQLLPALRERIEVEVVNSYRLEAENMSAAIRGEAPLLLGRADAVGQARAIEALYEAADTGGPVTLD